MKLSNETLTVMKNFANINSGLEFKQGNKLSTISPSATILATAHLKDSFPEDFCVYDMNLFLSVHSLMKDPEIAFDGPNITFKSGKSKINYRKTSKEMIVTVPDRELSIDDAEISLVLTDDDFQTIMKTANVLQSPNIAIESDGDKIYVSAFNAKDDSAHTNSIEISEGNGEKYKIVYLKDNLIVLPGSYEIKISSKGLSHFKSMKQDISYWIAIEGNYSKFGE